MASVLIVCHGELANALLASTRMIVGTSGNAAAVGFPAGMGGDELAEVVREQAELLGLQADGSLDVLILTDLPGGTPARVAAVLAATRGAETVTGVSLPMLAEVLLADVTLPAAELAALAYRSGRNAVIDLGAALRDQEAPS